MKNNNEITKVVNLSNDFKNELKVAYKNNRVTAPEIIALTIGRDAGEFLQRTPPKFDEKQENLIKFHNPGVRWLNKIFKA